MNLRAGTPARELGLVFFAAPALGLVGLLASGAPRANLLAETIVAATAWAIGAVLVSGRFDRANPVLIPLALFGGIALVSVGIFYGGSPRAGLFVLYIWTTPLAFVLLPRRQVAAYVIALGLCFAVVIYVQHTLEGSPIRGNFGRWLYVVGTVCFVGAVVRSATHRERRVDSRFRRTFHDSPIGQLLVGPDGRYIEVNEAFARMVGRPASSLVGLHRREITHPEDIAVGEVAFAAALSDSVSRDFRKRYVRPDGSIRTASVTYSALGEDGGTARQVYAYVVDITDEVEATTAARARDSELADATARYTRQQEALAQLGQAALEGSDIPALLQMACDRAVETLGVPMCAVPRVVAGAATMDFVAAAGSRGSQLKGSQFPIPAGDLLAVFQSPLTRVGPNLAARMLTSDEDWHASSTVASALILADSISTCRLSIATTAEADLTADDIGFLNAAATILGSAIARHESEERRRQLVMQLVLAQENERARVAGEIHDDSLQAVAASRIQVHRLRNSLDGEAEQRAQVVENVLGDASERLRDLLFRLSPPDIGTKGGLRSALNELASRTSKDNPLKVAVQTSGDLEVELAMRILIYRTVQESLVNTLKHAAASQAWVTVERSAHDAKVSVRDDGCGFDSSVPPHAGHIGLLATRTRVDDAGGSMAIVSGAGQGTEIVVRLPVGVQV